MERMFNLNEFTNIPTSRILRDRDIGGMSGLVQQGGVAGMPKRNLIKQWRGMKMGRPNPNGSPYTVYANQPIADVLGIK